MARIDKLRAKDTLFTGIDFIHIVEPCDQTVLRIYLQTNAQRLTVPLSGTTKLLPDNILVYADDPRIPSIRVTAIRENAGQQVLEDQALRRFFLEITVEKCGTYAPHRVRIVDPRTPARIDPFFNDVLFSFKTGCDSRLDCVPVPVACPPDEEVDFPIDYMARDWVSLRNALLDFAAQRYPDWSLPIEADQSMMFAEVLAALGDELSYLQDRIGREAFLETANQRRSLRRLARLLDFEIHDGRSGTTMVELRVETDGTANQMCPDGTVKPGVLVAPSDTGTSVSFEVGLGLFDTRLYEIRTGWNSNALKPFVRDEIEQCLPVGATEILLRGRVPDHEFLFRGNPPRHILLRRPAVAGETDRTHIARVIEVTVEQDPIEDLVFSRVRWADDAALPFELQQDGLRISFNVVPATAGLRQAKALFSIGPEVEGVAPAVAREGAVAEAGARRPTIYRFGLLDTDSLGLGFLGDDLRSTRPEVRVTAPDGLSTLEYRQQLIGAGPNDLVFTLEDGMWGAIRKYWTKDGFVTHRDYASGKGYSLRFGDGTFGKSPPAGTYTVSYRTGPGASGNLPAGAISRVSSPELAALLVKTIDPPPVSNPLAVTSGVDPESTKDIKLQVPQAYQNDVYVAVRPEDFAELAERLDFVQRANCVQRWTGSWHSMFVAADPYGHPQLKPVEAQDLEAWIDCVRQAGRDVVIRNPKIVAIDLEILLCLESGFYAAEVLAQVQEVLLGPGTGRRVRGFFHPDNFTFGTPLRRSALEATLHAVPGVKAVRGMWVRERGKQSFSPFVDWTLQVGDDEVIQLENDPRRPGAGTLRLLTEGGV